MKAQRLSTRDVRENRCEREEKLGQALETLPGKTLRDRDLRARSSKPRNFPARGNTGPELPTAILVGGLSIRNRSCRFQLHAPGAMQVSVAGTFNNWSPSATPLAKGTDGEWRVEKQLESGDYEYRFVVDGVWQDDPNAQMAVPNPFGSQNSVVSVG